MICLSCLFNLTGLISKRRTALCWLPPEKSECEAEGYGDKTDV